MLVKLGVDISRLKPPIRKKLNMIDEVYESYGYEAVITSTYEGLHAPSSLHYADLAIDLRIRNVAPEHTRYIIQDLRVRLGSDYDVVAYEKLLHIEYDPKIGGRR